jgi:hypothetical protein
MIQTLYRYVMVLVLTALFCALASLACHAATGKKKLLLFAKNPTTWEIIRGGASGNMVYHAASGAFTLNATKLNPGEAYVLIRYNDEPPKVEILARGTSDKRGKLALSGMWHNWTKKFWMVPAEDVSGKIGEVGKLTAWRPDNYLFEEKPLGIQCDCPEPDEPK